MAKALKHVVIDDELALFTEELVRDGGVYVSTRTPSLIAQSPPVLLQTELVEGDTEFATLRVTPSASTFFNQIEEKLVDLAISRKAVWFREGISDDLIRASLKSFVAPEERTVRVRVADGLQAFDTTKNVVPLPAPGTRIKAVIELGRITFSKTQFGAVWTLKQVKVVEDSKYLFEEDHVEGLVEDITESILAVDIE